ncbi:uncharacterized protein LOC144636882 [Oculina patagonica]
MAQHKTELRIVVGFALVAFVLGHGRLIDPASRNAAWRFGFSNPPHYNDNELNCGGFNVQWEVNHGKCGVCGDAYHEKNQAHIYPGKYANNIITKTYTEGQEIEVLVDITSNHQGFFVFSVGRIGTAPITQEKLNYVLKQANGDSKWRLTSSANDVFKIKLKLPGGLTCDHCVMQWWWTVGNNWGCDADGCGVGHGEKQETFVNCADIRITAKDGTVVTDPPTEAPSPTVPVVTEPLPTNAPNPGGCKAIGPWEGNTAVDNWCVVNCGKGYCPDYMCKC